MTLEASVAFTNELLPEPLTPVTHTNAFNGKRTLICLKLLVDTPTSVSDRALASLRRWVGTSIFSMWARYRPVIDPPICATASATFCEDEYYFFLGWQEAVTALVAIWPAATRSEVLTLQRIINSDIADACGKVGTWCLDGWAEGYALDLQESMQFAVEYFAAGDRAGAFDRIDAMRDHITKAMDRAEYPEE